MHGLSGSWSSGLESSSSSILISNAQVIQLDLLICESIQLIFRSATEPRGSTTEVHQNGINIGSLLPLLLQCYRIGNMCTSLSLSLCGPVKPTSCYCSILIAWSERGRQLLERGASLADCTWHEGDEPNAVRNERNSKSYDCAWLGDRPTCQAAPPPVSMVVVIIATVCGCDQLDRVGGRFCWASR